MNNYLETARKIFAEFRAAHPDGWSEPESDTKMAVLGATGNASGPGCLLPRIAAEEIELLPEKPTPAHGPTTPTVVEGPPKGGSPPRGAVEISFDSDETEGSL